MDHNREQIFLDLWHQGRSYAEIGAALSLPEGTVKSYASKLGREGKIKLPPRRGRRLGRGLRPPAQRPPSVPLSRGRASAGESFLEPGGSTRWTVHVPVALQQAVKQRAASRGLHPSQAVQEALRQWLAERALAVAVMKWTRPGAEWR
jgi:hypothetical protein